MLLIIILVSLLTAIVVPLWIGRHILGVSSPRWLMAFLVTGLMTNAALFPLTFLFGGNFGSSVGEELFRIL